MPPWLSRQIEAAFLLKNCRQIRMLNDCWYYYRHHVAPQLESWSANQEEQPPKPH